MSTHHEGEHGHTHQHSHHHACANLFGCGDEKGTGIVRGVRALIPKSIFASELRREMAMV